jgi:hypothetical protein
MELIKKAPGSLTVLSVRWVNMLQQRALRSVLHVPKVTLPWLELPIAHGANLATTGHTQILKTDGDVKNVLTVLLVLAVCISQ